MLAGMLENLVKKVTMDPGTIAVILEVSLGLAIAVVLGQVFAFAKYIKLNEPVYQIFSFVFTKLYSFIMNCFKYLGLTLLVYIGLLVIGYFMGTDYFLTHQKYVYGGYFLCVLASFALGFSTERTRSLNENICLLYTSPSPRDATLSRMPSSA